MRDDGAIAVVGMAAVFPGAPDVDAFRANLHAGVDAFSTVPPGRWDPVFHDPTSSALDRFYGDRGGFVDRHARFDPLAYGVVPSTVDEAEPDQLLLLKLAHDAATDAGTLVADLPRETTGVVVGRGGYVTSGLARSAQRVREGEQLLSVLRQVLPGTSEADLQRVKDAWTASAGDLAPDQAIGLVPNLAASRVANRLDLHGPAYTVDAACASALVAVDRAVADLRAGRLDAAFVGGSHLVHDVTFWSIFCRLGAMSRKGTMRPFDAEADGLLIGEGVGVVLLMRPDDALARGLRIRALIRGTGVASDGRGATLMAPAASGQIRAVRRAWDDAGLDPTTVGFIEAHGTATAAGDLTEIQTLRAVFGDAGAPLPVGSVKSMIGHAMPAAGIAGLIKAIVAVEDATLLPSLGVSTPHPSMAGSRLVVPTEATPWDADVRRAGVDAFGFGGIDAHVIVEQAPEGPARPVVRPVALYAGADADTLADAIVHDDRGTDGPVRLALRDPTPKRRAAAATIATKGRAVSGRRGTWSRPAPLEGRVAFLYPGLEDALDPGIAAVGDALGVPVPEALRRPPAGFDDLGLRAVQILGAARVLRAALETLGVVADVHVGHSVGEWSALVAAGVIPEDGLDGFVDSLSGETLSLPDVVFGVVGTDADTVRGWLVDHPGVVISHENCPRQTIVCGPEADVEALLEGRKVLSGILPFKSGFHTPHFAPFAEAFAPHIARVPLAGARAEVWSATTAAPWPDGDDAVRALLHDHLVSPVRFGETLLALHDAGVRHFVQLGAGSLPHFVDDALKGRDHVVVSASNPKAPPLEALGDVAAALATAGRRVDVRGLPQVRDGRGVRLTLGTPLLKLQDPPVLATSTAATGPVADHPLAHAVQATLDAVTRATSEVHAALAAPRPSGPVTQRWTRRLGVETHPFLMDHTLFQQPEGWPDVAAHYPVVPMTMNLELMIEAAETLTGRTAIALEDVRAWRWLVVEPPVDLELEAVPDGDDRVLVKLVGFAEGVVRVADAYPEPPAPRDVELTDAGPSPVPIERIYPDRWMFHGPAYQGMSGIGPVGSDGLFGEVTACTAPGATLDNVGQVFGFWGFARLPVDSLGFPARIERLALFGPPPAEGTRLAVRATVTDVTDAAFKGDMDVLDGDHVWCRIDGWQNRRFETDEVLLPLLRMPGRVGLAELDDDGVAWVKERWRTTASRELLVRRYLDAPRLAAYAEVPPWQQRPWVLARVAAADAVRAWWWAEGKGDLFPIQVQVDAVRDGLFRATTPEGPVDVAVAVDGRLAAATVSPPAHATLTLDTSGDTPRATLSEAP